LVRCEESETKEESLLWMLGVVMGNIAAGENNPDSEEAEDSFFTEGRGDPGGESTLGVA